MSKTPSDDDDLDQQISADLGVDIAFVELQTKFRLDLIRMKRGEPGQLAYILIDRDHHQDAAVVYPTKDVAQTALTDSPLIDDMCCEDCLDADVYTDVVMGDLKGREVLFE